MLTPVRGGRLKNTEVLEVLQRFQVLGLESSPQVQTQPQSGQLLPYDRAVVKHFRRDVHEWKKKRSPVYGECGECDSWLQRTRPRSPPCLRTRTWR